MKLVRICTTANLSMQAVQTLLTHPYEERRRVSPRTRPKQRSSSQKRADKPHSERSRSVAAFTSKCLSEICKQPNLAIVLQTILSILLTKEGRTRIDTLPRTACLSAETSQISSPQSSASPFVEGEWCDQSRLETSSFGRDSDSASLSSSMARNESGTPDAKQIHDSRRMHLLASGTHALAKSDTCPSNLKQHTACKCLLPNTTIVTLHVHPTATFSFVLHLPPRSFAK